MNHCGTLGIGVSYCGRSNIQRRRAVCSQCQNVANLTSCDATAYISALWLPLVPLGRRRLIDRCSACGNHLAMPLNEWRLSREVRIREALRAWERAPRDTEALDEAIATFEAFQDRDGFLAWAPRVIDALPDSAPALRQIGVAYVQFGRYQEGERLLRRALALADSLETREAIGEALVRTLRPEEAEPFFEHILRRELANKVGYLALLVQGYQACGRHRRALELMRRVRHVFPHIARAGAFRRNRKISRQLLQSARPIVGLSLQAPPINDAPNNTRAPWLHALVGPALLAAVLLAAASIALAGRHAPTLYLVNGLSRPYNVRVNGAPYCIHPGHTTPAPVTSTPVTVTVADAALDIPPITCDLAVAPLALPHKKTACIANPDGAAILQLPGNPPALLAGADFYRLPGIAPETDLRPLATTLPPFALYDLYDRRLGALPTIQMAQHRLRCEPDDERLLRTLIRHWSARPGSEVEILHFLLKGMARHPRLTAWQRVYQDFQARRVALANLASDYRARLSANPRSPEEEYLLARVTPDPADAMRLLNRTAARTDASPFALYDLALAAAGQGQIDEARRLIDLAARRAPAQTMFADTRDRLAALHPPPLRAAAPSPDAAPLPALGGGVRIPPPCIAGRIPTPEEWIATLGPDTDDGPRAADRLLAWIGLAAARHPRAEEAWRRAIAELRLSVNIAGIRAALELENPTPQTTPCAAVILPPREKAILLVALAMRHPALRTPCCEIAARLGADGGFPHDYLRAVIAAHPTNPARK